VSARTSDCTWSPLPLAAAVPLALLADRPF
jgi:hypothetical protein